MYWKYRSHLHIVIHRLRFELIKIEKYENTVSKIKHNDNVLLIHHNYIFCPIFVE